MLSVLITIVVVVPYILIALVPLFLFYGWIQRVYRNTARELKRFDRYVTSVFVIHVGGTRGTRGVTSSTKYKKDRIGITSGCWIDPRNVFFHLCNFCFTNITTPINSRQCHPITHIQLFCRNSQWVVVRSGFSMRRTFDEGNNTPDRLQQSILDQKQFCQPVVRTSFGLDRGKCMFSIFHLSPNTVVLFKVQIDWLTYLYFLGTFFKNIFRPRWSAALLFRVCWRLDSTGALMLGSWGWCWVIRRPWLVCWIGGYDVSRKQKWEWWL